MLPVFSGSHPKYFLCKAVYKIFTIATGLLNNEALFGYSFPFIKGTVL